MRLYLINSGWWVVVVVVFSLSPFPLSSFSLYPFSLSLSPFPSLFPCPFPFSLLLILHSVLSHKNHEDFLQPRQNIAFFFFNFYLLLFTSVPSTLLALFMNCLTPSSFSTLSCLACTQKSSSSDRL